MAGSFGPVNGSRENENVLLTIGHSTRSIDEFLALLLAHGVSRLVDVRTVPRSRHNPQFNRDTLPEALADEGILYTHLPGLGGLRHARADSPNRGWHNESFRGFADYMQTEEFAENIEKLMEMGKKERIAVMCAEALPWRCHRSLIADALMVRGVSVAHIMGKAKLVAHELTSFARTHGTTIIYPAEEQREEGQP
ncbi:MAG: DUF488 domain-containing protein [Deltaproteobacteria bacterium]|nr:DUF488 domain-containing protein [Deltaproteobacteria bacterium]TLN04209.1 MAG: DUF488 domain-containing protein [bacterium]